jgi:hypothetical protein
MLKEVIEKTINSHYDIASLKTGISEIILKEFQKPRTEKMNERIEYFKKNQNFETQIVVDKDNNLIDGYTTYLIAKKYGINFINVINNS